MYTPTVLDLRIAHFILTTVGILATCFRLWRRKRTAHFWWDDAWAALAMMFAIICIPSVELSLQDSTSHMIRTKIALYYLIVACYMAINWTARLSILFTVIRISVGKMRYIFKWIAAAFVLTWLILTAQVIWTCEGENADWGPMHKMCVLPLRVAVIQLTTDVLSDAILVVAPLHLIWKTKLLRAQKIRITIIFSTTLIMTVVSLNHACWLIIDGGGLSEAMSALIQYSISLVICNFSVIIAFIFKIATEDSANSYCAEAWTYPLRFKAPNRSGMPPGTGVHIERTEVITLDIMGSVHGSPTTTDQLFYLDRKECSEEKHSASII